MERFFSSVLGDEAGGHPFFSSQAASAGATTVEESKGPPPASKRALRQLPTVVVTPEDLVDESNRECCICLEENKINDRVIRLPCAHIFHTDCITDWLKKHCTCPVCRYELPTDDPTYEQSRKERMRHRKPRYAMYELRRMSIADLRSLALRLGIPRHKLDHLIEKSDFVAWIVDSGKIDLISSPDPVEFSLSVLRQMGAGKLKRTMADAGVFFDPIDVVEKEDMVQIFVNSGRVNLLPEEEEMSAERENVGSDVPMDMSENNRTTPAPSSNHQQSANTNSSSLLAGHSVSKLRALAREWKVDISDCIEKSEMIQRLSAHSAAADDEIPFLE